jgi:PKD repeat protein
MKNLIIVFVTFFSIPFIANSQCDPTATSTFIDCDSVWFVPATTGAQYTYLWDFGDGNSSTDVSPTHVYSSNGSYTAFLTLSDTVSGCSNIYTLPITVNCNTCQLLAAATHNVNPTTCEALFVTTVMSGSPPYTYFWDFGDGTTSNLEMPTHQYPNASTWTACVTITDANGCDTTMCQVVSVSCTPIACNADFTYSYVGCDSLWFAPTLVGSQYTYIWDFGNGDSSTDVYSTTSYSADGTYPVVLTIQDTIAGCTDILTIPVTVDCGTTCAVQGDFAWNVDSVNCNTNFVSTAFGGTAPYTYFWTFGDGGTSTVPNPTHQYPNNSSYTPCLKITDVNGCDTTICQVVSVNCTPTSCDAISTYGYIDCNTLWFLTSSSGPQYSYLWDFGDGSTSTLADPTHDYATDGTYIVLVSVSDTISGCQDAFTIVVDVNCGTSCNVQGAFNSWLDTLTCEVNFVSTAFGGTAPYTFFWNFGDGATSTVSNPVHQYPNNSAWTPCLTITDVNGCDTTICMTVSSFCSPQACDANFTYTYAGCDSLWFIPVQSGSQYSYNWDFGNGNSSTDPIATTSYSSNGTYPVILTIEDTIAGCFDILTIPVTVNCGTSCSVQGAFNMWVDSVNCEVNFVSTAFGGTAPYTFFWDFGDGNTSTVANPVHQYLNNTTWTPCLTITDANGCDTTMCMAVAVSCSPVSCNAVSTYGYTDCNSLWFLTSSSGNQFSYFWDFGDGSTSTLADPTHDYAADGTYIVLVSVSDTISGCQDAFTMIVTVNCGTSCTVQGAFNMWVDSTNCDVNFVSTAYGGTAPYTFFWNFGDGTTSTSSNPVHQYPYGPTWTPCLTITDANGCDTTICDVVIVDCTPPTCDPTATYTHITCDSLWFIAAATGPQYSYLWDFGDGDTSTDPSPTHLYNTNGSYIVVLYLTDSTGNCSAAFTQIVDINCGFSPCDVNGAFAWYPDSLTCEINFVSTAYGGTAPYSYFWNFGDGNTSAEPHPTNGYPSGTTWTPKLTITDANGCDTTIYDVVYVDCFNTIDDSENEFDFIVYPNPSTGLYTIQLEDMSEISVYDISGSLIVQKTCSNNCGQFHLDLSHLRDGTYILMVNSNDAVVTKRLIKL